MAYIIFTLDNSVIYDIRNNFLGLYFRDEKAISYSPFLVDQYFGYKGSSCIPKCDIEEFQYFPKSWDLHTVCGFEEFKHSSWYDELTAGQITLEIIRSDPLRYPSKQNNCLEEYGLLYQVRNRLTNQILSKNVLMPDKLLEEIFDDQDSVSTLFYSQELVFINLKCFKEFNITLEARLSTGYSQQSLLLYHYRDWTCGQLLEFIKNNEFPVNSYDCELCLFSSECEVTQYVSRGSNISVLADKAATVALSQSRIRFKLDPVPLVSKFHVKVIIDKSCQDEECISQVRKIEKFLKRRPDETEYIVAVMNEDIYFYLTTNDPIKEDELFRKPLLKIPFLQRLNVLKDGSQTIHLSKHILSSPISISTN